MEEKQIAEAITKAHKGISQYLEIMTLFPNVNASDDADFRRKFNAFYRVRQRPPEWYTKYFSYMERHKGSKPSFDDVLDDVYELTGRYEPSFSSKLVATLNPEQPVWDIWVLRNTNTRVPSYASKRKVEQAKVAYRIIQGWYQQFLKSKDGELVISVFDRMVPAHTKFTNLKKVDFVLWQTRED
ncbi:MAG: hypothetical protein ABSA33_03655 [Candidatus Micrarchaeaceae archaeon]|jgi:hypothetical protein